MSNRDHELRIQSVPGSGTHFMMQVLKSQGHKNVTAKHWGDGEIAKTCHSKLIFAPVRHPLLVWATWAKHDRGPFDKFYRHWEIFDSSFRLNSDLYVLPLDIDTRDYYLNYISGRLLCKFESSWRPVNASEKPEIPVELDDIRAVLDLPVVRAFYR